MRTNGFLLHKSIETFTGSTPTLLLCFVFFMRVSQSTVFIKMENIIMNNNYTINKLDADLDLCIFLSYSHIAI